MRTCKVCQEVKDESEFYLRKDSGLLRLDCISCHLAAGKARREKNRDRYNQASRRYWQENRDTLLPKHSQRGRERYWEDPEKKLVLNRKWRRQNRDKCRAYRSKSRAATKQATPIWLDDDHLFFIYEIYDLAVLRGECTGIPHEVDHIIPLQGTRASGLHVPWNLQVLTRSENRSKANKIVT